MSTRNSGRRGFASMDPEERRQIARRGGQASHGGYGREYSNDFDNDRGYNREEDEYDEEDDHNQPYSRYEENENEYDEGYGEEDDYEEEDYNRPYSRYDEDDNWNDRRRGYDQDRGRRPAYNERGSSGGRGFASMDPDQRRRIASEGGRAYHEQRGRYGHDSGGGRGYSSDRGRDSNSARGRSDNPGYSRRSSNGGGRGNQPRDAQGHFTSRSGRRGYGSRSRGR